MTMTAIAGIAGSGKQIEVEQMVNRLVHRGQTETVIGEANNFTFGAAASRAQPHPIKNYPNRTELADYVSRGHFTRAVIRPEQIVLERDPLGLAPLYYGWTQDHQLCFASEVKALLPLTRIIYALPPGSLFDGTVTRAYFQLEKQPELPDSPEDIAKELRLRLQNATFQCINGGEVGSWLSGGLDSSSIAALARPQVKRLHTFAAGLPGAPDLDFAREVASFIQAEHHEVVITFEEARAILPEVIYHLESFDPLLVRSTITNYLVAKRASEYVPAVFSGEGGDELFAGYEYLKSIPPDHLADELIDITLRLHNTALQRVDRSASAYGTVAHVVFLDPDVVDFALKIPTAYKIYAGTEKWILRRAMEGLLPESVLQRGKAKFWEGAGIQNLLAQYADEKISDGDFIREQILPNGWSLATKEELLYYRIFQDQFGILDNLDWMGRTKATPT